VDTQLQVRVAGSAELLELLAADRLDVVLCIGGTDDPAAVATKPMLWMGDAALAAQPVLPLAVLEPPCRFRDAALAALNAAGRPYRIVVETPSLSVLRAALESDLCVTCRTDVVLKRPMDPSVAPSLPPLPSVSFARHTRERPHDIIVKLADLLQDAVLEL
jgi:DNA-binding transcriptional LysR family regulator